MVEKTVALISRRSDLTRAAFRDYYETRHAFLGMRHFQFRKYLRNHLTGEDEPGFDVFSEFWNVSVAKAYETMAGPIGDVMRADERNFMEQSKQRAARSTEMLIAGQSRGIDPTPTAKEILLLNRDPSTDKPAFLAAATAWGAALASANPDAVRRVTLDAVTPFENNTFPYDAILSVWLDDGMKRLGNLAPPAGIVLGGSVRAESCETTPDVLKANYRPEG